MRESLSASGGQVLGGSWAPALLVTLMVAGPALAGPASLPASQPVGEPAITIFRDPGRYVSFPDVKRLPDGRLLCVFRDATYPERVRHIEADARVVGAISADDGRHWSKPFEIYDDRACQNDPSVAVLHDGRLLLNFFTWEGLSAEYVAQHKPPFARKVDRGEWGMYAQPGGVYLLWGKCQSVPARSSSERRGGAAGSLAWDKPPLHVGGSSMRLCATSASALETRKGTLLLPVYRRAPKQSADDACVIRSTDGGRSWGEPIEIARDPAGKVDMQEPALGQAEGGDIVALMRTDNAGDHLYMTRSSDDGLTWVPAQPTPIIGHPADLLPLSGGKLLAVYGYRHEPFGVRACVSPGGGRTWDRADELVITAAGSHGDLGYPSVCRTGDGHVLVAYYMNGPGTRDRWIECTRVPLARLE